jgi:hypothetical protein
MQLDTSTPQESGLDGGAAASSPAPTLIGRISRLEIVTAALIVAVTIVLVILEPDILEAPFENERTLLFTLGGTLLAALALVAMLWLRVPPLVRVIVLAVPLVIVSWWLISPYFVDDVVDESFATSIAEQTGSGAEAPAPAPAPASAPPSVPATAGAEGDPPVASSAPVAESAPPPTPGPTTVAPAEPAPPPPPPSGPVLLGAGQFVGLAGHSGTGDAGIFQNPDGSLVLRFERFDIENGPDLEVYLVPGADQVSLPAGSIHLGALKGNVGDQNYELPAGTVLAPGAYTALVWCEAFSVEFVGATIVI